MSPRSPRIVDPRSTSPLRARLHLGALAALGVLAACGSPAADGAADADQDTQGEVGDSATSDAAEVGDFTCSQVIGVSVTGEWFTGGFESWVADANWQAVTLSHAYVDLWADPTNSVWSTPITSACAKGAASPDRVLFVGVQWTYTQAEEWRQSLEAVVANLRAKYPQLKRIDLLTMLRAPGNQRCPDAVNDESVVQPFIDDAIAQVVAAHPGLVFAAPKFEAPGCDVFIIGGPHLLPDGQATIGKLYGSYYASGTH